MLINTDHTSLSAKTHTPQWFAVKLGIETYWSRSPLFIHIFISTDRVSFLYTLFTNSPVAQEGDQLMICTSRPARRVQRRDTLLESGGLLSILLRSQGIFNMSSNGNYFASGCRRFGPTRQLKYGLAVGQLTSKEGTALEFYENELTDDYADLMLGERYFDTPDMMKCSSVFEDLASATDDTDSLPAFERLKLKMTDVIPSGSVKKVILSEGVGTVVPPKSRVQIHYHAFMEDLNEPFDSSYLQGKPIRITLGNGDVIPGLDLAVGSMRKREKSRFLIEPNYAYGIVGCAPRIPPNARVLFEVELLNFTEGLADLDDSVGEGTSRKPLFAKVVKNARAEKGDGIQHFSEGNYLKAQRKFLRCINILESAHLQNEEEEAQMMKLAEKAYQNMALCALKLGNYGKAHDAAKRIIEYAPDNPKALFIAGKSLRHLGNFALARKYVLRAKQISPTSGDVRKELKLIDAMEEKARKAEVDMCRKIFKP